MARAPHKDPARGGPEQQATRRDHEHGAARRYIESVSHRQHAYEPPEPPTAVVSVAPAEAWAGITAETWPLLLSTYALVVAGSTLVAVVEMSFGFTLVAAALCAAHALTTGPAGRPLLGRRAIQQLGVVALAFSMVHAYLGNVHLSYGLAHFLILAQLIVLYGPHGLRDLRLIQITAVFELLIADRWALHLGYLLAFLLSAFSLMANMVTVEMHRTHRSPEPGTGALPMHHRRPRLAGFLAASLLPAVLVFSLTAVGFVVLPRHRWIARHRPTYGRMVTGFSQTVSLREVGELRQSNALVFKVRFRRMGLSAGQRCTPPRLLMRGTALASYRQGQWRVYEGAGVGGLGSALHSPLASFDTYLMRGVAARQQTIVQDVELAGTPRSTIFALYRPVYFGGQEPYGIPPVDPISHSLHLYSRYPRRPQQAYQIVSQVPEFSLEQLQGAGTPDPDRYFYAYWRIPRDLRPVLENVRLEVEEQYDPQTDYERVLAAQRYLRDPSRFTYTLNVPDYGSDDPVASFLTDTRRGHCEHFASALALITRGWRIPTRVVVGFKGGTYDERRDTYSFRDKHAHAWVEVYFNGLGWVEFDPTPSGLSEGEGDPWGVLGGAADRVDRAFAGLTGWVRRTWSDNVVGYDRSQQTQLFTGVASTFRQLVTELSALVQGRFPGMPDLGDFQIVLLIAALTGMAVCLRAFLNAAGIARVRVLAGLRRDKPVAAYDSLIGLLRRKGIHRTPAMAARELAREARLSLAGPDDDPHAAAAAVDLIVDAYCRARFGRHGLTQEDLSQLRQALATVRRARRAEAAPA
jgi:transglutaminase-like putative cysteine protease